MKTRARILIPILLLAGLILVLAAPRAVRYFWREVPAADPASVPDEVFATWAKPVTPAIDTLPNLHRVSDVLYRGAQPTSPEGFRQLKAMGINTVVNLRSFTSGRKETTDAGLAYESIYMKAWHPEDEDVVQFVRIVTDPARQPVFVHCQHGSDRTGTMCAVYRVVVQGWDKEAAIREMTEGGFGFHEVWAGLPKFLRDLDVPATRQKAGLPE